MTQSLVCLNSPWQDVQRVHTRVQIIFYFIFSLFILIIVKAVWIQVIKQNELVEYANGQFLKKRAYFPHRGKIVDAHNIPLAINIEQYGLYTIPSKNYLHIKAINKELKQISKWVPELTYQQLKNKTYKRERFTWLARKISLNEEQIKNLSTLQEVFLEKIPGRIYPQSPYLSQVLGLVGVDQSGLSGIELKYDPYLRGKSKIVQYWQDAKGRPIRLDSVDQGVYAKDLTLSIDIDIQAASENFLKQAVLEHKALGGGIGVMNSKNGEILAMANYPNTPAGKIPFISDPFEPGSVFKIFTLASALEENLIDLQTSYFCEKGSFKVQDHIITEAEAWEKFEWLTVAQIIEKSSNIGITKLAFDTTYPVLKKYFQKFRFGEKTGIELPGESRGIFPEFTQIPPLTLATMSFGQGGIATTGIQILAAYAMIANGGMYYPPTIIKQDPHFPKRGIRILKETTTLSLMKSLVGVIEQGTGVSVKMDPFSVAGKTGTAQRISKQGGYEGYISSFAGILVDSPEKYVIFTYIDNPKGNNYYANHVAAPIFKKLAQRIYYKQNVTPTKRIPSPLPLKKEAETPVKINQAAEQSIPNFIGLDKISVERMARKMGFSVKHHGIGLVYRQSITPGNKITLGMELELYYHVGQFD